MKLNNSRSIEIPLEEESFGTAIQFIEQWMQQKHIKEKTVMETLLLVEAVFNHLIEQGYGSDTMLTIKVQRSFGESSIRIGFEGEAYVPVKKDQEEISPELSILQGFSEKVEFRYRLGYNRICIVVKRHYRRSLIQSVIGVLLAILTYALLRTFMGVDEQLAIEQQFVFPLVKQFANAMLMIGAPVTFFSLVKNLTDIYILSEKSSSGRELQIKTIITSVIAILLAIGTSVFAVLLINQRVGYLSDGSLFKSGMSVSDFISSMVPGSIFEPFETYLPFPIIVVALLLTYALCSIGEHFDIVQRIINVCFTLFSKMLNVVMYTLPFFCFLMFLSMLLTDGFEVLLVSVEFIAVTLCSVVVIIVFYLIRLLIGGVSLGPFLKHLPMLIWENIKINSAIDAVPFNIRYCVRHYGYDRKRLSEKLPILAQTNQDGNCFLIMLVSMLFIFMLGIEKSWFQILAIAVLILFLSFGAPNQPGSMMTGMLIITFFLHAEAMISIAIFSEVFFGSLQNIINVGGDIVTVAIEENKAKAALKKE